MTSCGSDSGNGQDGRFRMNNIYGADGRSRTGTACATAPSRQRVYQFHHIGCFNKLSRCP